MPVAPASGSSLVERSVVRNNVSSRSGGEEARSERHALPIVSSCPFGLDKAPCRVSRVQGLPHAYLGLPPELTSLAVG